MSKMFIETAMDDMYKIRVKEKIEHYEQLIKEVDDELEMLSGQSPLSEIQGNDNGLDELPLPEEDNDTKIKRLKYRKELYLSFIDQFKSDL